MAGLAAEPAAGLGRRFTRERQHDRGCHDDPQDRRAKILRLTDEGLKTAALMDQALTPFRRKLFGAFDPADVEATLRVLSGLPAAIVNVQAEATDERKTA